MGLYKRFVSQTRKPEGMMGKMMLRRFPLKQSDSIWLQHLKRFISGQDLSFALLKSVEC